MSRLRASAASPFVLGAALAAVAFGASGGSQLGRTTVVEVLLLLAGGAMVAAAVAYGPAGPLHGGTAVLGLAALAALAGLSIAWSIAPQLSLVDAGRALAYLAVFAGAVGAARLWPRGSAAVAKGILLAAAAVLGYALASRIWPASLAEHELSNRLSQPFAYWNAVGTTAALAVPLALWLGSRRTGRRYTAALAYPLLGAAALALVLTYSRGALAAALVAAAVWFAVVPLRLRSVPVLVLPLVAAAPVAAWALSKDAFSKSQQPLAAKEAVAGEFGLLVVLMVLLLLAAGLAVCYLGERWTPSLELRRRAGIAAVAAAFLIPLVLVASAAGSLGDRIGELTDESAAQPKEGAGRFVASSSTRSSYWREAGKVFADRRLQGTGAGTFGIARLRYRKNDLVSRHAHGWVPQTIADLGIAGLAASLVLLVAWVVAAARSTGLSAVLRRRAGPVERVEWTPERTALVALTLAAVAFGLQSAIDWTWFVPGAAAMALVAAGFVAGRGPGAGRPEGGATESVPPAAGRYAELSGRRIPLPDRARLVGAAAVLVCALLCAWAVWQPERSDRLSDDALTLAAEGRAAEAVSKAREAQDIDPLSPGPVLAEASAQAARGDRAAALRALERAVLRYPSDPVPWQRLAVFQLAELDRPASALETLRGLLYLDPKSRTARQLFLDAQQRRREQEAERVARSRELAQRSRRRG